MLVTTSSSRVRLRRVSLLLTPVCIILASALLGGCTSSGSSGQRSVSPGGTPTETPNAGTFYFTTEDGVTLNGHLYGSGTTAVVFSNQVGGGQDGWLITGLVQQLTDHGYMALTYEYRGDGQSQGGNDPNIDVDHVKDLHAAIGVVRAHGATQVVLVGASLGGLVTLKVAASAPVAAVVALSAPQGFGALVVTDAEVQAITAPKLFLVSAEDDGFTSDVEHMYSVAPQPKQLHVYPGRFHGVLLLPSTTDNATPLVMSFIAGAAPT